MLHRTILLPSQNELKTHGFQKDSLDDNSERYDRSCNQIDEHGLYKS